MRSLPLNRSVFVFWDNLVYAEAALLATPETAPFADVLTAHLATFGPLLEQDLGARRGLLQAYARGRIADGGVDDRLRTLHADALHAARQDRDAPGFRALFPDGLAERIRHALARQLVIAADVVEKLSLRHFDDAFRAAHVPALQAAIEAGRAALEARRKAELARTEARLDVQAWKEEANALCLATYSQLLALAARERRGRAWADAFFLGETRDRAADEPEAPDAPDVPTA